jgi:hypothetical protein
MFMTILAWFWGWKWYFLGGTVFCYVTGIGRPYGTPRWSVRPIHDLLGRSAYVAFLSWLGLTTAWWFVLWVNKWVLIAFVAILIISSMSVLGGAIGAGSRRGEDYDDDPSCPVCDID